jgi:metal-dependent HD superfamily phosphatase/phosphodiesterase
VRVADALDMAKGPLPRGVLEAGRIDIHVALWRPRSTEVRIEAGRDQGTIRVEIGV